METAQLAVLTERVWICAMTAATEALEELVAQHGDALPLAKALWALALEEAPDLKFDTIEGQLNRWAEAVTQRSEPEEDARVVAVLFDDVGLSGNTADYYGVDNSLLHRVIDRRTGLPITLSIIYVEVVRRAGGQAEGVGFPGHFLAQHRMHGQDILLDPFRKGRRLSPGDLKQLLSALGNSGEVEPWMVKPASGRAIVTRVLANLKNAYLRKEDVVGAVTALDRWLVLEPERTQVRRDRGLLYGQLGLASAAVKDIEAYLADQADAKDAGKLEALLPLLRQQAKTLS